MKTTAELREGFLSFFESKGHKRLPSWPLIPRVGDHSTLLTTAGMQPQMPYFLGREQPPAPLTTTVQKCFRTPDIDEVGLDGHHLTFFEMLGNFSFGQYFKAGAIELATEFVRERLGLDWDRVWVTVHAGDPELGLGEDETAVELWEQIGVPRQRIIGLPSSENFWSVGGPGPCGPDSEIYWDWGEQYGCGDPACAPACARCDRFLEFWNLVFMEYELRPDRKLVPLPEQNVDTGMGLERTAAVLQDVRSVFETDGYQSIMGWIESESGIAWDASETATKAHRVLADHGRGMTFLAAEGIVPSNEGRGYLLRRLIRRTVVQARRIGLAEVWPISVVVTEQMEQWHPELREHAEEVARILRAEEERFSETLSRGLRLFEEVATGSAISGADAFRLHDTYGFPFEVTRELAGERGLPVDEDGFRELMEEQRERSRQGTAFEPRIADAPRTAFVGYERTQVLTSIVGYEQLEDDLFQAKLEDSPFYPEGGGQVSDVGWIENDDTGARAELVRAIRLGDDQELVFRGTGFAHGTRVRAVVPWSVRFPTMANHTATHLLHQALHEVLGEHAKQAGSAVRPDKLRFDFTHPQALTSEERERVEHRVNEHVFQNLPVRTYVTTLDEARNLGAMMLFGEKYGDEVRVVEIAGYSRELCGGTHVRSTAEIGPFVILSEGSVGSGVRRIEAVTAGEAWALLHSRAADADELRGEVERLRREAKKSRTDVSSGPEVVDERRTEAGDVHVIVVEARAASPDDLLALSDRLKQQHAPAAIVLGAREDGTAHLILNFDRSLESRGLDAGAVVKQAAALMGGGGGGRPTMARAGGKQPERLGEALAEAERLIVSALS